MNTRALRRGLVLTLVAALLLLLAASVGVKAYGRHRLQEATARFEADVGPLELRAYGVADVPSGENAARLWQAAGKALVRTHGMQAFHRTDDPSVAWTAEDEGAARALLAENRAALVIADLAEARRGADFEIRYSDGAEARLPNLLEILYLGRLLVIDARAAANAGSLDRAVRRLVELGRVATALQSEPSLICTLVGLGLESYQTGTIRLLAGTGRLGQDQLLQLLRSVPRTDLAERFRTSMGLEGATMLAVVRHGSNDTKPGSLHVWPDGRAREESLAGYTLRRLSYGGMKHWATADVLDSLRAVAPAMTRMEQEPGAASTGFAGRFHLRPFVEVGPAAARRFQAVLLTRELTQAGLEALLHRHEHGSYPVSLPSWTSRRQLFTGKPLRYETLPGGAARLDSGGAAEQHARLRMVGLPPPASWTLPAVAGATRE